MTENRPDRRDELAYDRQMGAGEPRLAFLPLVTLLLLIWTGFLYAVLLVLRVSQIMLAPRALEFIVFAPGGALLIGLVLYELGVLRRH